MGHHKGSFLLAKCVTFCYLQKEGLNSGLFDAMLPWIFFKYSNIIESDLSSAGPSGDAEECWRTINPALFIVLTAKMSTIVLGLEHTVLGVIRFPSLQVGCCLRYIHLYM